MSKSTMVDERVTRSGTRGHGICVEHATVGCDLEGGDDDQGRKENWAVDVKIAQEIPPSRREWTRSRREEPRGRGGGERNGDDGSGKSAGRREGREEGGEEEETKRKKNEKKKEERVDKSEQTEGKKGWRRGERSTGATALCSVRLLVLSSTYCKSVQWQYLLKSVRTSQ